MGICIFIVVDWDEYDGCVLDWFVVWLEFWDFGNMYCLVVVVLFFYYLIFVGLVGIMVGIVFVLCDDDDYGVICFDCL